MKPVLEQAGLQTFIPISRAMFKLTFEFHFVNLSIMPVALKPFSAMV